MRCLQLCFVLFLCSCSSEWYARKAMSKNPDVFKPKSTVINTPPVSAEFDCKVLSSRVINVPREFRDIKGNKVIDTVRVILKPDTVTKIVNLEIDCPDHQIIEVPTPFLKVPFKKKIEYFFYGAFMAAVLLIIFALLKK